MLLRAHVLGLGVFAALACSLAAGPSAAMTFTISTDAAPNAGEAVANSFGTPSQSGQVMTWMLNPEFDEQLFQETAVSNPGDPTVTGMPVYLFNVSENPLLELDPSDPQTAGAVGRINTWIVSLKEDPFITNSFNFTNTSGGVALVSMSVLMPIGGGFFYDRVIDSSVGVTLTDSNGNATASATFNGGDPVYSGRVNTTNELLQLDPDFPLSCASFPGCTDNGSADQPVDPLLVTPDTANNMVLWIRMLLSDGDTVGVTSRFEIQIVPEPSTALLLGLGMVGMAAARRARR